MRLLRWIGAAAIACGLAGSYAGHAQEALSKRATVHVRLVSTYGIPLNGRPIVDLFQPTSTGARNRASSFNDGVASGIPYGEYRLRVHVRGFWTSERVVRVFQPEVTTVVALEIGVEGDEPTYDIGGIVENAGPDVYLRLSPLYSIGVMDEEAGTDGRFTFSKVPEGMYILSTSRVGTAGQSRSAKVLDCRAVRVPFAGTLVIDLKRE